jgi:hypothetical protein
MHPHGEFDLADYWAKWLVDFESIRGRVGVRIRVAPGAVDDLPRFLGEDVRARTLEARDDPTAWLELDLTFGSLDEARAQLLGLGPSIVVEQPVALRDELAGTAAEIVSLYRQS